MGCGLLCRERKVVSEEWIEENGSRRMESAARRVFGQCSAYGVVCHAFVVCKNVVGTCAFRFVDSYQDHLFEGISIGYMMTTGSS